jgi:N-acetylglucosaminyl-diphospho-decaprenol L-rhamnosyltransferase
LKQVSVVIVSFNARDHLRRCLDSLFLHLNAGAEVIVVDNASPDGSADMVAAEFPAARLVRRPDNAGFSVAANAGARLAGGDVIAFLNPDCEVRDDVFSGPAGFLRENPDVGALGPKVLDPDGSVQLSVRRFHGLSTALFNRYSLLTRFWPRNPFSRRYLMTDWDHATTSDVDWISGACLLTRKDVLARHGYFDEAYFWGFEDVDFCQRLHRAGLRVVYYPDAAVVHEIGASARTVPSRALIARHRGMWKYYRDYMSRGPLLDAAAFCAVWGRCGLQLAANAIRRAIASARRSSR